jgi:hypothetical protein
VKGSLVRILVWFGLGIGNSISSRAVRAKALDDKPVGQDADRVTQKDALTQTLVVKSFFINEVA